MFIRQQARQARFGHHFLKERLRDVAGQQPIAILGKGGRVPDRIVHAESDKPPKQHAVIELLHQEPLAPNGVEHLRQQRPQQLLTRCRSTRRSNRRDSRSSAASVIWRIGRSGRDRRWLNSAPRWLDVVAGGWTTAAIWKTHRIPNHDHSARSIADGCQGRKARSNRQS